jgi:shikimate kinase
MTRTHIVLLGMMGAGKTTVGDLLSSRTGRPYRDSDRDIERMTGRTGREIAADDGVDELHRLEEEVLLDAVDSTEPCVVSAAGWVIESPRCRAAIQRTAVAVWLRLSPEDLRTRMDEGSHRRDLPNDELSRLLERREPLLLGIADIVIDATRSPDEIVDQIVDEAEQQA